MDDFWFSTTISDNAMVTNPKMAQFKGENKWAVFGFVSGELSQPFWAISGFILYLSPAAEPADQTVHPWLIFINVPFSNTIMPPE